MPLPHVIARRLREALADRLRPLILLVDTDCRLLHWQGDAGWYGLDMPPAGSDCRDLLPVLYGQPLDETLDLAFIEAANGRAFHLRLLQQAGRQALLITDATAERDSRRRLQQQANEVRLLQGAQQRLISRLETAQVELQQRQREAEEASRIKGHFIAGMSHEFRTPLAAILGQVDTLRDEAQAPAAITDSLEAQAGYLLSLIDNMLDQAKLESGQLALAVEPMDLHALGRDMHTLFEPMARKRGLAFELDMAPGIPERLKLDPIHLRRVIINLVGNAVKYTPEGQVRLRLAWVEGNLDVAVADTGPGIPEEARRRIFQAFHQEPGRGRTRREGVGLGLSISARLVAMMGGAIQVETARPSGSVFSFRIPAPACADEPHAGTTAGLRVLLADDNADMRRLLARHLEKGQCRVEQLAEGARVLAVAQTFRPHVVIMDLYLGEEDGIQWVQALRQAGFTGGVLLLSASSLKSDQDRALAAGCDEFLQKPVKAQLLRQKVARWAKL